ncbi:hypothetical protein Tco_0549022 [Tanacetum coccineum]
MNRSLFTRIVRDLSANCPYFQEGCDDVGKVGISALVKCTYAIRQLAYAAVQDSLDEYLQIGEKTSRDSLMHFCNGVIELYGEEYLRRPTQTDVEKLYAFHENKHGFPGSNNNVNVLRQSPVLNNLKVGKAPGISTKGSLSEANIRISNRERASKKDVERCVWRAKEKMGLR